jgi:hypothetical protein
MPEFTSETGKAAAVVRLEKAQAEAQNRRKRFAAAVKGAQVRSEMIPTQFLSQIALPTAGVMLAKVLNGELEPKSAKEAVDIAKMAVDLHVLANRTALEAGGEPAAPVSREEAERQAKMLRDDLQERMDRMRTEPVADEELEGSDAMLADSTPDAPAGPPDLRSVDADDVIAS